MDLALTAPPVSRAAFWAWARPAAGLTVLAVLLWRLGTGPFLDGLRLVDAPALVAATALGAVTTVASAWRWTLVAGGLGLHRPLPTAVADCYRSVFLNSTLPGGVLGDVHRAVRSGRDTGDVGRGVRAVVWERTAGQLVQLTLAAAVLATLPSPVRHHLPVAAAMTLTAALACWLTARTWVRAAGARWVRTARADVRAGLLAHWPGVVLASAVAVSGHVATFLVAARAAGVDAPLSRLLPLALLALLAMSVPATVGGFGPREGVAAWAFGATGLTAAAGVTTGVLYGVLVLAASLPGAAVLLAHRAGAGTA